MGFFDESDHIDRSLRIYAYLFEAALDIPNGKFASEIF